MKGFIWGSVALAALYVLVQPKASSGIAAGTGWLATGFHRLLSPGVAAIPQRAAASSSTAAAPASTTSTPPMPGTVPI